MTAFETVLTDVFDRRAERRLDRADEVEVIAQAKAGDEAATLALIYAYAPALRSAVARTRHTLDQEEARSVAVATLIEAISAAGHGEGLGVRISQMLSKAMDEAFGAAVGFAVPTRTLQRFYGILREADGDTTKAAALAPSRGMTVETFVAVLTAVREVDALDGWTGDDTDRADLIERARPVWDREDDGTEDALLVETAFRAVTEPEAEVVRISYGFEDPEPQPDAEVAHRLGLSRQKVQRTRAGALGKMRTALGVA